jgi:hypothetical protein
MERFPLDRILNVDETAWKTVAPGFLIWAHKNLESVQCLIENNEKEGMTVIAAVTAAGIKLPLTVIGKSKTPRCLAAFHLSEQFWAATSASGWTTDVMVTHLGMLRQRLYPEGPLAVVFDTYAAHRSAGVIESSERWRIELVFTPRPARIGCNLWTAGSSVRSRRTRASSGGDTAT